MSEANSDWRELAAKATRENDTKKLRAIVDDLIRGLDVYRREHLQGYSQAVTQESDESSA